MRKFFFLLPLAIFLVSCASAFQSQSNYDEQPKTLIQITNADWNTVKVYIGKDGILVSKIGSIEFNATENFYVKTSDLDQVEIIVVEAITQQRWTSDMISSYSMDSDSYFKLRVEKLLATTSLAIFRIPQK